VRKLRAGLKPPAAAVLALTTPSLRVCRACMKSVLHSGDWSTFIESTRNSETHRGSYTYSPLLLKGRLLCPKRKLLCSDQQSRSRAQHSTVSTISMAVFANGIFSSRVNKEHHTSALSQCLVYFTTLSVTKQYS
jgi:hypothetical protein